MKLTDENNKEYEFEYKDDDDFIDNSKWGLLKPIEKEWPQEGDNCWYIDGDGEVYRMWWTRYSTEISYFMGIYKTREEAELARDRIQSLQKAKIKICVRHFSEQGGMRTEDFIELTIPKKYLKAWKALEDKK